MIHRSEEALLDLAGHVLHLHGAAGAETAMCFVDAVDAALTRLEKFPHLGRVRHFRQPGLRSWSVPGFGNWILFYLPLRDGVSLYRVIHGAMDLEEQLGREH